MRQQSRRKSGSEVERTLVHLLLDEERRIGLENLVDGSLSFDTTVLKSNEEVRSGSGHGDVVSLNGKRRRRVSVKTREGRERRRTHDQDDGSALENVSSKAVIDDEARGLDVESV